MTACKGASGFGHDGPCAPCSVCGGCRYELGWSGAVDEHGYLCDPCTREHDRRAWAAIAAAARDEEQQRHAVKTARAALQVAS